MTRKRFAYLGLAVIVAAGALSPAAATESVNLAYMFRQSLLENPNLYRTQGEEFTWHAAFNIDGFMKGYEAFQDTRWLDEAVQYYDWLISRMATEPDGYKGWVGPHIQRADLWGSHVVGDANLIAPMLEFAEIVHRDEALREQYGEKAAEYIELAKHIIEKWDARGSWVEDGPFAVYRQQTQWATPDEPGRFRELPNMRITENMNKSGKMGVIYLRLYRITGEPLYRERAEKIFSQYKRIMRYYPDEDRYVWNFWEPFGEWDMTLRPVSWVAVHPNRAGYQALEAEMMAEAYHTGVVFTEEDMRRIINTNLWMWNNSLDDPQFKSADGRTDAGTLWAALAEFDATIRELYRRQLEKDGSLIGRIRLEHFNRVIAEREPGFERRYVTGPVSLPDIPVYPSPDISSVIVVPTTVASGELVRISAQVEAAGTLYIDLYDEGGAFVRRLFSQQISRVGEFYTHVWNAKDPENAIALAGTYRIRWTLNDSVREREITIKDG